MKSTVEEIRKRFDNEVDRFSNLSIGQETTIDAQLVMELIVKSAAATNPEAQRSLDIGCGAGNYTIKLLHNLPDLHVDLIDLSQPMLDRAKERLSPIAQGELNTNQGDIRELALPENHYDIVIAAASLHHLRTEDEWEQVFDKVYHSLKKGGSFWISDLVEHSIPAIQQLMWRRYGTYLTHLKEDPNFRDKVLTYIEKEDSPRPLMYQLDLLKRTGFNKIDVLHKNSVFAAFGGVK